MRWANLFLILTSVAFAQQSGSKEDWKRGESPVHPDTLGQREARHKTSTFDGILVSGSCKDRADARRNAKTLFQQATTTNSKTVNPAYSQPNSTNLTPNTENIDVLKVHNDQQRSREPSGGICTVDAGTTAFALLTPDGRWLDLDPAGNTLAAQALHETPKGRDLLAGQLKVGQYFHASVTGRAERQNRIRAKAVTLK